MEPGNLCRSIYTLDDIGKNKAEAAGQIMKKISPFCNIHSHTYNLYGNINYNSQEDWKEELHNYDLIFDCTASNELLHFLSFAFPEKTIISICITNHAQDMLCLSSLDGNVFEQRKIYLSMLEQDTNNFYVEGTGCYSPTFLATVSNISYLLNMYLSELDKVICLGKRVHSVVINTDHLNHLNISYNQMRVFQLINMDIRMNILDKTLYQIQNMPDSYDYAIGYLFGGYSEDRKLIFISHAVSSNKAEELLEEAFTTSEGVIDYIGEIHYSGEKANTYDKHLLNNLSSKALDTNINTNNPLVCLRNPDGSLSFYLYINDSLCLFTEL